LLTPRWNKSTSGNSSASPFRKSSKKAQGDARAIWIYFDGRRTERGERNFYWRRSISQTYCRIGAGWRRKKAGWKACP
jgi:hypothetical protein